MSQYIWGRRVRAVGVGLVLCLLGAMAQAAAIRRTFDLPRVEGIEIDGQADDWKGKGYGFEILLSQHGKHREAKDHNASMKLGWTPKGMLFLVWVQDDVWHVKRRQKERIASDHVDIYLRKVPRGEGSAAYHLTLNPRFGKLPLQKNSFGGLEVAEGKVDKSVVAIHAVTGGETWYVVEGLIPWESVDLEAVPGAKAYFQLWSQDGDTVENEPVRRYRAAFHLGKGTSYNGGDMHVLKLVDNTKPKLRLSAVDGYDLTTYQPYVKVMARGIRRGHEVTIRQGTKELGKGVFKADGPDRVSTKIMLPAPPDGKPYEDLTVSYRGEDVNTISLPHSVTVAQLRDLLAKRAQYAKLYRVNEPWVPELDTPVLEQHRGLVAAAFTLLDRADPPSSQADFALLSQAAEAVRMAERGESYYDQRRGCFFGYIYSNALGTGSYFLCVVPDNYDPAHKYPLVYTLHAGGGTLETHDGAVETDYIQVFPWGHGYNSFRGMGEVAARDVLAYVLKWYSIDENRVYVGGHSNGGNGTWFLTTRYPRFFAGGSVSAGEPLRHLFYSNLGNMTILNRCGALDTGQPVNIIKWAESRLEQLGHPMDLRIFPKEGHGRKAPFDSAAWRAKHVRNPSPLKVSHTCEWAAHGESYWFDIRRLTDPHRMARVEAEAINTESGYQTVLLKPTNVAVLALDVAAMPVRLENPLRIRVADVVRDLQAPLPTQLYLVNGADGWQLKRDWQPPARKTRPYRSGGAENMYNGEPLLIVYPTLGAPAEMTRQRKAAEMLCRSGGSGEMATAVFPMKADRDITQADMEHYNLILVGRIEDNQVTGKIWPKLPLTLTKNRALKAGGRTLDAENAIISLHVYNPLAPKRLVYLIAPVGKASGNPMWTRALLWFLVGARREGMGAVPDLVVRGFTAGAPTFRYAMQFTRGWAWKAQDPKRLAYRFTGVGKDDFIRASRALLVANSKADFVLARKESGLPAPVWGLDTERTTGADWILSNPGNSVARSVVTGKTMVEIEQALNKKVAGRPPRNLAFMPILGQAKINPAKRYRIAFSHDMLRGIFAAYGELENVQAGGRYTPQDILTELMKTRK